MGKDISYLTDDLKRVNQAYPDGRFVFVTDGNLAYIALEVGNGLQQATVSVHHSDSFWVDKLCEHLSTAHNTRLITAGSLCK